MSKDTMKALVLENFKTGEFLEQQVARPSVIAGQVLVRIVASGVNPIDYKIRTGNAPYAEPELPAILGTDLAGIVESVGEGVTSFTVGDEVYGMTGGVKGLQGTLAEFAVVDADSLARKPKNISMREAAAIPLVFLTAWEGLIDKACVHEGQNVLIQGGAGGVGHMATQIAKAFGANVFATASKEKHSIVESYGATAINYNNESVEAYVQAHTSGEGFDIVYDTVGGQVLDDSLLAVKSYGHVLSCFAFASHNLAPSSLRCATLSGIFVLLPLLKGSGRAHHGEILQEATRLIEAGEIKPLLDERQYQLSDAIQAHHDQESGKLVGKLVINIE